MSGAEADAEARAAGGPRPASWTAFGVINIIFGGLGVLGSLASQVIMRATTADRSNPVAKAMHDSQLYQGFIHIVTPLSVIAGIVLITAGIGLLRCRGWGRMLSLGYAWYALLIGLVALVVTWVAIAGPMLDQAATKSGVERAGMIGGAIGGMIGSLAGMVYPILLLILMRHDARDHAGVRDRGAEDNPYQAPGG